MLIILIGDMKKIEYKEPVLWKIFGIISVHLIRRNWTTTNSRRKHQYKSFLYSKYTVYNATITLNKRHPKYVYTFWIL
jgi:hypothetical protein